MSPHKLSDNTWKIVTVNQPVMMPRTDEEVWPLNPLRRYLLNTRNIATIADYVATVSDLTPGGLLNPLRAGTSLSGTNICVERYRDRGIGDLLFLTGPAAFMQHAGGHNVTIDFHVLSDRGPVLWQNPDVRPLCGPLEYDHLRLYNFHWFIDTVTECNEEPDQPNVYDALYASLGFDPNTIDPKWKRPKAVCGPDDYRHLDQFFRTVWGTKKIDLRHTPFYVVCPFAAASVRSMSYAKWLKIIAEVAKRRPVIVCGNMRVRQPDVDMSAGAFMQGLNELARTHAGVYNAVDSTPLRVFMALVSRARALICLDSGPLYLAQAFRVPAVSIWGCHAPGTRLLYDPVYMDLAIWHGRACEKSPCFTYIDFPAAKCPRGAAQTECEVLSVVEPSDVQAKLDVAERQQ